MVLIKQDLKKKLPKATTNIDGIGKIGYIPNILAQSSDATAYRAALDGLTEYYSGLTLHVLNWKNATNNANATLNINNLGAKPIFYRGRAVQAGEFPYSSFVTMVYSGSGWSAFNSGNGCWIIIDAYYKDTNTTYSVATTSANGLMSSTDKTKLDGIATSANNYSHPNSGVTAGTNYNGNQTPTFGGTFNIPKLTYNAQGHITASANSTVTIPNAVATTSASGLMSKDDKSKLDGITASADAVSFTQAKTSGIEIGTITINGTATKLYQQDNNTTYSAATSSANGLLTSTDFNAIANLKAGKTYVTDIVDGSTSTTVSPYTDFNDYKTPGLYSNNSNVRTNKMSNTPWGSQPTNGQAFSLVVLKHVGVRQLVMPYNTNDPNIYIRNFYNGSWGSWYKVYTNNNLGNATTSATGLMSSTDKTKLDGIATGANKTTIANNLTTTTAGSALDATQGKALKTAVDSKSTVSVSPTKTSGVEIGRITVDGTEKILYQQDNNTTYSNATTSAAGLMSKDDKSKLDGITASADAVSFSRSLSSGTKIGTLTINGTGTDLYCNNDTNTTYSAATQSANGLMSSTDKKKLDGIDTGANAYTHPSYTARTGKPTANQTPAFGGTATVSQITSDASGHVTGANDFTIKIPNTNASTSAYGITKLYNGVDSTSTALAATANAVKTAYDLANGKPSLGTTASTAAKGNHTHKGWDQKSSSNNWRLYVNSDLGLAFFRYDAGVPGALSNNATYDILTSGATVTNSPLHGTSFTTENPYLSAWITAEGYVQVWTSDKSKFSKLIFSGFYLTSA